MALWGMVIDLDRCTGCQACVMACKAENNVPAVGAKEAVRGRIISWMQVLTEEDGGTRRRGEAVRPATVSSVR